MRGVLLALFVVLPVTVGGCDREADSSRADSRKDASQPRPSGYCAVCGEMHQMSDLEPAFSCPDAFFRLSPAERSTRGKASNDLCVIEPAGEEPRRCFVRGVLNVKVEGRDKPFGFGLWVEVDSAAYDRIRELWDAEDQGSALPFPATIANRIDGYPDTTGLRAQLKLTSPTTSPSIRFAVDAPHPFVRECRSGVTEHVAAKWLEAFRPR